MTYDSSDGYESAAIEILFSGKPQEALQLFEEGLRRFPDDPDLLLGCGMALNDLQRHAEAREIFARIVAEKPNLTDALQGLAEAELALGDLKAGAEAARRACDHPGENNIEFVHSLALLLYRNKLFTDAEHCYRRAVEIDRAHGHSWLGLASSLHQQERRDEAIQLLKEAVEDRLPGFWEAYSYLGCMLCDAGRVDEAVNLLEKIPLDELRDPAAVRRLRSHLDAEKHPERAKVLEVIEERARAALAKDQPKSKKKAKPISSEPWQGTFVIGPIRGDDEGLLKILKYLNLVDERGNWLGRQAALVVLGPILGKGRSRLKALRYIEKLAKQAGRVEGPGHVAVVAAPGEDIGKHGCAYSIEDEWLTSVPGISGEAAVKAWMIVRGRYAGGGPYRPPVLRALASELAGNPKHLDGEPDCDTGEFHLMSGQLCASAGAPEVRVDRNPENLIRFDSGLGSRRRLICLKYFKSKWTVLELPLAQERFLALKAAFVREFGLEFPTVMEPDSLSEPLHPESDGIMAFSRVTLREGADLPVTPGDFDNAPRGAWMTGQWGYGVNSYAFYFVRKDERREIFLRLPYGGAYGDIVEDSRRVREFLLRYAAFETWAESRLARWRIESNMGSCLGWLEYPDGRRAELPSEYADKFRFPNES